MDKKPNLTKREIITSIHGKNKYQQKEVATVVQGVLDTMADALKKGERVELRGFGILEPQVRKSRVGRNPNKPEVDVIIPDRVVIKFKAGKELKDGLSEVELGEE